MFEKLKRDQHGVAVDVTLSRKNVRPGAKECRARHLGLDKIGALTLASFDF